MTGGRSGKEDKRLRVLAVIVIVAALFVLMIRFVEPRFVFFPLKYPQGEWDVDLNALGIEEHYFTTEDSVRLHAWFWPKSDALATILLIHGNAGNLSQRLDLMRRYREHLNSEIFIFDYRGYGRSEGYPSEKGVYLDAQAAYAFLTNKLARDPDRLIILGRSLGGAVAVDLAQTAKAAGLILDSTFSSGKDMARQMFGIVPVWWFMTIRLASEEKIPYVRMPILFVHGTLDEMVPMRLGRKLYEKAPAPKKFVAIEGARHNDIYITGGDAYYQAMREFIEDCLQPKQPGLALR